MKDVLKKNNTRQKKQRHNLMWKESESSLILENKILAVIYISNFTLIRIIN